PPEGEPGEGGGEGEDEDEDEGVEGSEGEGSEHDEESSGTQTEKSEEQVDDQGQTKPEPEQVDKSEPEQVEPEPELESEPESEPEPESVKEGMNEPDSNEPESEPDSSEPESKPEPTVDTSVGEEAHNEGGDTGEQEANEVSTTKARVVKEPEPEPESEPENQRTETLSSFAPVAEEEEEPDIISPSIIITLGEDKPAIGVAVPITIVATDNVAITNITCTIDGKKKRAQTSTGKGTPIATSTYTFTPEEAGDYTVIATATDKAGNSIEASEVITVAEDKDTEAINFNAGLE
ncbi:MAG: hypothetical protein LUE20_06255, partial [Oscillospiraceae bacterium]|nr:hypothetical protein [Oscillospiraceae bacterium]